MRKKKTFASLAIAAFLWRKMLNLQSEKQLCYMEKSYDNLGVIDFGQPRDMSKNIIKVIGVGGGGCNAVRNMYEEGMTGVTFAVCNTDSQSLVKSPVPVKIMLGSAGLGAGANPEVGRKEAQQSIEPIKKMLDDGTQMVFVTAGMGGGTGTGAAPVVAGIAKAKGILTVGIVTIPFWFEKRKKIVKALKGVEEMRKNVDALLIINNERLCDVYADSQITVKEAFHRADDILGNATKSISELITVDGDVNLDFRDVETTMRGGGGAIMAMGRASGEKRVEKAILNALDSPLLYGSNIDKAEKILFNIYTSPESPLVVSEIREIDAFMDELNPDIDVIWGVSDDDSLNADAKVTILATGLDDDFNVPDNYKHADDDTLYDGMIKKLYCPKRGKEAEDKAESHDTENFTVTVGDGQGNTHVVENEPLHNDNGSSDVESSNPDVENSGSNGGNSASDDGNSSQNVGNDASGAEKHGQPEAKKPQPHSFFERVKRAYEKFNAEIIGDMGAE